MDDNVKPADIFDLSFTKFVTPVVIKIAFVVMIVMAALVWLGVVVAGFGNSFSSGIAALVLGGLGFLLFVLMYRIMFELVMVIFAIKKNTDRLP